MQEYLPTNLIVDKFILRGVDLVMSKPLLSFGPYKLGKSFHFLHIHLPRKRLVGQRLASVLKGNYFVAKGLEILYKTRSLSDCGCTFRLIKKHAAQRILPGLFVGKSHFLPNMIIAARLNDVDFIEIPVTYKGRTGESKITGTLAGTWKTGLAMVWLILRMWPIFIFSS